MVTEVEEFLGATMPRQDAALRALLNGDVEPHLAMWTRHDPVTLFGAGVRARTGWSEVSPVFHWLASRFSDPTDYRFDVVSAGVSGDLAYVAGFEHKAVRVEGAPATDTLRITQVYRRENGEWRIVHRHGDRPPADRAPGA